MTYIPATLSIGSPTILNPLNAPHYLHTNHLSSVSVATSSSGAVLSSQSFDPWGKVRSQTGTSQTKLNYTGQRLDDTGLLYYHARYYDPVLGRFVSPDSIVPGASSGAGGAGGTVGQEQNSKLTVDFHEAGFLTSVRGENQQIVEKGFWFQLSGEDKQTRNLSGPINPQALNRYSYVLNNPLRYTDPSGHYVGDTPEDNGSDDEDGNPQDMRRLSDSELKDMASDADTTPEGLAGEIKGEVMGAGAATSKGNIYFDKKTKRLYVLVNGRYRPTSEYLPGYGPYSQYNSRTSGSHQSNASIPDFSGAAVGIGVAVGVGLGLGGAAAEYLLAGGGHMPGLPE